MKVVVVDSDDDGSVSDCCPDSLSSFYLHLSHFPLQSRHPDKQTSQEEEPEPVSHVLPPQGLYLPISPLSPDDDDEGEEKRPNQHSVPLIAMQFSQSCI